MRSVRDADSEAHVTGRTATVTIDRGGGHSAGRKLNITDLCSSADMAAKPSPARIKFRIDGPVPAVAKSRLRPSQRVFRYLDRSQFKQGTVSAVVTLGLPIKAERPRPTPPMPIRPTSAGFRDACDESKSSKPTN